MRNVYLIKTDIKVKANTFLNINILAEDIQADEESVALCNF